MNSTEATRKASIASGRVKILEGLFELLDTHVSMDLEIGSLEFDKGCKQLETLEATIAKVTEERDFFWSLVSDSSFNS